MNYNEALEFIHGTYAFGIKLGLDNIGKLLEYMDNPQDKLKYVHIAGTNGKGSTSNMISNVLKESGYRVGLFISPYLEEFTERIQINGTHISKEDLGRVAAMVKESIDKMMNDGYPHPSEFEVVTAIGLQYFYEKKVDIVALEVGMGGRFDATNVIKTPEVSIITSIAFDHMQYLGNTLEEITFEKAGIIKENGHVVLYPQGEQVEKQIREICVERNNEFHPANPNIIELKKTSLKGQELFFKGSKNLEAFDFKLSLLGKHQILNCTTALTALDVLKEKGYHISVDSIQRGMSTVKFPGRFELLQESPTILVDGAHNENGIDSLVNAVKTYLGNKVTLFFGVLSDKDYNPMIDKLRTISDKIYTVSPNNPRAMSSQELAEQIKKRSPEINVIPLKTIKEGVDIALNGSKEDVFIFVGSLYMIGEARTELSSKL